MTYKEFKESEFSSLAVFWLLKDYGSKDILDEYETGPIYDNWIVKDLSGKDSIMVVYISEN